MTRKRQMTQIKNHDKEFGVFGSFVFIRDNLSSVNRLC
jgi:hypothetical protein